MRFNCSSKVTSQATQVPGAGILKIIVTWFTFALSSVERSEPSLFSSSVAVGSRLQTIGIYQSTEYK